MIKKPDLTKATGEVVALKLRAIDQLLEDFVEPIADVGNPEQLIKKPYETWTPQDLQLMTKIYGTGDDTPLANLIFRKKYEEVKDLEEDKG